MQTRVAHLLNHPLRIFPRAAPMIEGAFVAPRFQHHYGRGAVVFRQRFQLLVHVRVAAPAVGADPQAECPLGRQRGLAGQAQIRVQKLGGRAQQPRVATAGQRARRDADGRAEGHFHVAGGVAIEAEARVRQEERRGKIRPLSLPREMLHDLSARAVSLLIHMVKSLARAPYARLRAVDGERVPRDGAVRAQSLLDFAARGDDLPVPAHAP